VNSTVSSLYTTAPSNDNCRTTRRVVTLKNNPQPRYKINYEEQQRKMPLADVTKAHLVLLYMQLNGKREVFSHLCTPFLIPAAFLIHLSLC